jgi:hypothetical protein
MTDSIGAGLPSWIGSGHYHEDVRTESVSGTVGLDLSTVSFYRLTLTGDTTFEFTSASSDPAGNSFVVVEQDGTGGHSISWPAAVEWGGGSAPGLSTAANDKHMVSFVTPDGGSTWIGVPSAEGIA